MRAIHITTASAALFGSLVILACSDSLLSVSDQAGRGEISGRTLAVSPQITAEHIDDDFSTLATAIPGFGGLFFDHSGNLNVYLTDPTQRPRAVAVLKTFFASHQVSIATHRQPNVSSMRVLRAEFSWPQLQTWAHSIEHGPERLPGLESFDIRESTNRIEIGVSNDSERLLAETLADRLGVPRSARLVSVVEPEKDLSQSLSSVFNPIIGGIGIVYNSVGSEATCTLGVNVRQSRSADTLFLTAGHCTYYPYQPGDSSLFWQPDFNGGIFGQVWYALAPFSDPTGQNCPPGDVCRNADVLLGIHTPGLGRTKTLGTIARTTFSDPVSGSVMIDQNNPTWTITQSAPYAFEGEQLSKVGRTTGWTEGFVTATDQSRRGAQGVVFLNQVIVGAGADEGDSGAPVFGIIDGTNVRFMGILRGGVVGQSFTFSNFGSIQEDMGLLLLN